MRAFWAGILVGTMVAAAWAQPAEAPAPGAPALDFDRRFGTELPQDLTPGQPAPSLTAIPPSTATASAADVFRDPVVLPVPVRRMRDDLIAIARTGDLAALKARVAANRVPVRLSDDPVDDPVALWAGQFPDSQGLEVLSILLDLFDTGFVRVDAGTANEMWVWPHFAHIPLDTLGPADLVELYRLVTSYDFGQMRAAGAWTFFRIGIAPDGTVHYFLARD